MDVRDVLTLGLGFAMSFAIFSPMAPARRGSRLGRFPPWPAMIRGLLLATGMGLIGGMVLRALP